MNVTSVMAVLTVCAAVVLSGQGRAGPASEALPVPVLESGKPGDAPVTNAAFLPGPDATAAAPFAGTLKIAQAAMQTKPALDKPVQQGRDARLFPAISLTLFTSGDQLAATELGEMVRETGPAKTPSYWRVIPQVGRVWREPGDGDWSRAALPMMLVNDTENHAHQGLATFLYKDGKVTALRFQFIQQTAPYLLQHFVAWGAAPVSFTPGIPDLAAKQDKLKQELADRLPAKPWSELVKAAAPGTLDGFGGPLKPEWLVTQALVRDGVLYYQESPTPYGPYPYPLEMRFGVRSVTKSVGATLSLMHLAEIYGPWVMTLKIGDYVKGLDPKYNHIRFMDAADMASGFGGLGSLQTNPNPTDNAHNGYLDGDYDGWYTAPSVADKIAHIDKHLKPYPWEPGTVWRYRDQDYFLLGLALNNFLKSVRGPDADIWDMVKTEVLAPIGVHHGPLVRTREPGGKDGPAWFNAGYYPTMDDLAKIATLYQNRGAHDGQQLLHKGLTTRLMGAQDAIRKKTDMSIDRSMLPDDVPRTEQLYQWGFHFLPTQNAVGKWIYLPEMHGSGNNQVILFPNGLIAIRMAKGPDTLAALDEVKGMTTIDAVGRLSPF